ncbi:MAG: hypothetical protein CMO80_06710 [Verrucomicrobiales bacterium]|nr:hypothetical protein [Verrucomicrobiales bacterium]|tara:strand:- start:3535 stop:3981 length:447 start_codon:yes stop_codon:yes gene_type:complete
MPASLKLLSPWNLPHSVLLAEGERIEISSAIKGFLAALQLPSVADSLARLRDLPDWRQPDTAHCTRPEVDPALRSDEIRDYDKYFLIEHVTSSQQAFSLLHSLRESCRVFLEYCAAHPSTPNLVEAQKQGFISHARLLQRVFGLEETR